MSQEDAAPAECAYHPGYPAQGQCARCGQPLCATCLAAHEQDPRYCPTPSPPPPPRRPNTAAIVLGVVAGVLLLCLIVVIAVAVIYYRSAQATPPVAVTNQLPPESPPTPPEPPSPPAIVPEPAPPPSASSREQAALAVALADKPGWVGKVNWHKPDWSEVRVWIGPFENDLRLSRALWWDPSVQVYQIIDEGPVPKPPAQPSPPPRPSGPQPGEKAAKAAALENDPGWVAKVVSHSSDWKKVTVWTGPPQSEFVYEYRFHWDDGLKQYVLDHVGPLGGDEQPPGE